MPSIRSAPLAAAALLTCVVSSCADHALPLGPAPRVRLTEVIPPLSTGAVPKPKTGKNGVVLIETRRSASAHRTPRTS